MASRQIQDPIEKKGRKDYDQPGVLVLDVSRLGPAGRMPFGMWTTTFRCSTAATWAIWPVRRSRVPI